MCRGNDWWWPRLTTPWIPQVQCPHQSQHHRKYYAPTLFYLFGVISQQALVNIFMRIDFTLLFISQSIKNFSAVWPVRLITGLWYKDKDYQTRTFMQHLRCSDLTAVFIDQNENLPVRRYSAGMILSVTGKNNFTPKYEININILIIHEKYSLIIAGFQSTW